VIIECTSCHAKYKYDEDRFEQKPSKKIKCSKCQNIFEIFNPAAARQPSEGFLDSTSTSRGSKTISEVRLPEPELDSRSEFDDPLTDSGISSEPQMPVGKRLSLAIINGPDAGSVFRIEKPRTTIGRATADLLLNDAEASRVHAALEIRDTQCTIEDLGSTNGTLVDGEKIAEPRVLQNQGEFQIGSSTMMLIVTDEQ
jgi:pSer/pThr/pTyr-binding forkhead associated (FHA) protein